MTQILPIYRAIQFIEENLKTDIAVADMADAAAFSLYHFCRTFAQVVHHSPYDYLIRRRLSEAARELIETDKKIIDIGFEYQFNSPETFSRAFKRMFDLQPSQWKKQNCLDPRCLLPAFSQAYLQHINRGDYLKPVFAQKPSLHFVGVVSLVEQNELETIAQLWDVLNDEMEQNKTSSPENYCGLIWYPSVGEQRGYFYMAAIEMTSVEIKSPDAISSGLVTKTVPASTYARFIHKGAWEERQLTLDYIYQTWLPKSDQRLSSLLEIEYYGQDFQPTVAELETKIYIPLA
jgi:AraC family transcriptional regulator